MIGRIGRMAISAVDPETAHALAMAALRVGLTRCVPRVDCRRLAVEVAGLSFPNPLGMAAGFDKDAEIPDALLDLGFGFAELGTLTPRPQSGNAPPRIFRLPQERAVINRLGFNNKGHQSALDRLAARRRPGLLGINLGANRDSPDRIADYELGITRFAPFASYFAVNISSPNTPGLRELQSRENLAELLSRIAAARDAVAPSCGRTVPLFLKIAPDLDESGMDDIAAGLDGATVEGLIVSNTTIARPGVADCRHAGQAGGLSGPPLFDRSTIVLAKMRRRLGPRIAIIGVGGVDSAERALEKMRAGADLVQLYTGMIYGGPLLPSRILREMEDFARSRGLAGIADIRDSGLAEWANRSLNG